MKRAVLLFTLLMALTLLGGCGGGQEIESCLFVLSMAVDPAEGGNLTVTVKALSGTQEAAVPQEAGAGATESGEEGGEEAAPQQKNGAAEGAEPGYVVMSATADSCLDALDLLGATTPRTVNLSQLREVVLSRTLAESGAALTILQEILALYQANGEAIVVVTPDDAGDFIRRQYALFGIRLSQYLDVLFDHFEEIGTIPPDANLSAVVSAMQSGTVDAAAVYAAGNDFGSTLVLHTASETDRLPGHLPRTSPARNEYLGSALFSGAKMTGVLTGDETSLLRLLCGRTVSNAFALDGAMFRLSTRTRVARSLESGDGVPVLGAAIRLRLTLASGTPQHTAAQLAADIEQRAAALLMKLQAAGCDAIGYGRLAVRRFADIPSWERSGWADGFRTAQVRVRADVSIQ